MKLRQPQPGRGSSKNKRKPNDGQRERLRRRREKRHSLLENLETRQLLAGPELIGVQPNEGSLLFDGTVLNVSPRELVFRFDDNTVIDPETLSAIRITRAGEDRVFESATATSDLGSNGQVLLEFRAAQRGGLGNGVTVTLTSSSRTTSAPIITTTDRNVTLDLNSNPANPTRVQDLISGVANDAAASALLEIIQVSGPSLADVGTTVQDATLTLQGANAAEAITDFGTSGEVRVRLVSLVPGVDGRDIRLEVEQRAFGGPANPVVVVTDQLIRVQLNSSAGFESTAADFISAINNNPDSAALVVATVEQGNVDTVIGNRPTNFSPISLSGVSDVVVNPGFVGLGDTNREVIFRFAEPLPDDIYQIEILGSGPVALRNVDGELFQDGEDLTRTFSINLGPQVAAVVPEPVRRRADGSLSPETGKIEVHFNDDDLAPALAENPAFYQLIYTRDTANNIDDVIKLPNSVQYDNINNTAILDFGQALSRIPDDLNPGQFLSGAARLRIGASEGLPAPPTEVSLLLDPENPVEPGDSFATAFDLGSQWTIDGSSKQAAFLSGEIFNPTPYELDLPGPDLPGTRDIRPDDPTRLTRTIPLDYLRNNADVINGISVIQYNFAPTWLGDDPNEPGIEADTTYFNIISEEQKQRVREVLQLYSEYLGVSFVEVEGDPTSPAFFSVAVGDLYGGDERINSGQGGVAVVTRDRNGDGIADLGVMDFQDFDESIDDQFGGEFFRGAMFVVGQLLGYGYADDLPQPVTQSTDFIFTPGTDNEPAFPSVADIVHGQYLYRPDSIDIDMFRFDVNSTGDLSIETIAERLGVPSLLNTALKLYRADGTGSFVEIAQNDDYFSNDSLINIRVTPGTYMVGVSARGNTNYDPSIEGTGFGGLTEGQYELRIDFEPVSTNNILDTSGVALDGDGDGRPGGFFDFWFVPSVANTIYVDKIGTTTGGQLGTVGNPYTEIDQAIAASRPGDTIRVLGNGGLDGLLETPEDNFSYQIGFANNGLPLVDGSSLNLPQGVRMVIDAGAILKFSRSRLGVGSVSPLIDASDAALQILGTPTITASNGLPARDDSNVIIPGSVYLTSINDDSVGMGNITDFTPEPQPGDWGGIDFRGDLDTADELRRNRENEGVFLNHIQYADIRYGGGAVSIGGQNVVVSPIDMAITRPTIVHSRVTNSADAAIAATPDTFEETRFTSSFFQQTSPYTPDYSRVGPDIRGNFLDQNSINGLFIRLRTRTGDVLETVTQTTRFDDTDITHVLTENLVVAGTPGGPIIQSSAPSSLLIRFQPTANGTVPAGQYQYRLTNVNRTGIETAASQPTITANLDADGGIILSQLPTINAGSDFVSRRLYRAEVDPATGLPGTFRLVANLNASDSQFIDRRAVGTLELPSGDAVLRSRLDASLIIDPGTVLKVDGARIEAQFGANVLAEGTGSQPIIFTSIEDQRYGNGGTFDTNNRQDFAALDPGDWGGLYIGAGSTASIDNAVIAGAGGTTRIEGGFASFNAIEVHQAFLRLTNSVLEDNADGRDDPNGTRVGRNDNSRGTVFVRGSQPVVVGNDFVNGAGPALTFDINSLNYLEVFDQGRSTGALDAVEVVGNNGPLIQNNSLTANEFNGMEIRGGQLATGGVWDDVDIVHVVTESIEVPNEHIFGGLRLRSDARGSLVVKFENGPNNDAGIVVGGTVVSAADEFRDIPDRIGGALQLVGHPDFPVILTTLADDFAGAGFTRDGLPQVDTNNDGVAGGSLAQTALSIGGSGVTTAPQTGGTTFTQLPTGPEVNRGLTIDNDVDVNTPGYFEATIADGNDVGSSGVTVNSATGQLIVNDDFIFAYRTYVQVGNTVTELANTNVTQPAALIADDVVESRGSFTGPNGEVNWVATSRFINGVPTLFSSVNLSSDSPLGDIRLVSYLDEDVQGISDDILAPVGTPGDADFRAFTLDGPGRFGFAHGGFYLDDGVNLSGASYAGWAADQFNELETAIVAGTQGFSIPGTIDLADLPAVPDPDFGTIFGPNDVTTAFAWDTIATSSSATITAFLELLASDPTVVTPTIPVFESGLWNGVTVREAAHDRNVAAIPEEEPVRTSVFNTNAIPSQAQFLGELAPNEQSGDENRRLGFVVDGAISTRDDVDVFSFVAESGTEVWLDIDRTGNRLDAVVELINANGQTLAASNDSILAETDGAAIFTGNGLSPDAALAMSVVPERLNATEISIEESIIDATGGTITLSIEGSDLTVDIPVDVFLMDPASAIENALETTFPELGDITAALLARRPRLVDPVTGATTRVGEDFTVQLRFDLNAFIGRSVPTVQISTINVDGVEVDTNVVERLLGSQVQDAYTSNPKDPGMRVRLPGEAGTRNLYHIRVRSANTNDPLDFDTLVNGDVRGGLTLGRYELQVRLSEVDEVPGTQVRLADIRYATNGLQIIGQPLHSPLLGEDYETAGPNDTIADAQPLGLFGIQNDLTTGRAGPLQSDRLAKSFAGLLDSETDVDWYTFDVTYENLTRDNAALYLSTVFDLDYADNFARSDMALYVFNSDQELILVGGDSSIADDQPGSVNSNDTSDLSRGSAGTEDPFIGAAELAEGTYFVAVANQTQVPTDQFFNAGSLNPLLRLEPIDSVTRIVEDRIGSSGGGTASPPVVDFLFDANSVVDYEFDDVVLYVNTINGLFVVNPFTGASYGQVGNFGAEGIRDIAFQNEGTLFGYTDYGPRGAGDDNWFYTQIDTADASLTQISQGAGISTHHDFIGDLILEIASDEGLVPEAITIREFLGRELGFFVANRPVDRVGPAGGGLQYYQNVLYDFNPDNGLALGPPYDLDERFPGAGTSPREVGEIDTTPPANAVARQLGIGDATEIGSDGVGRPRFSDGDVFSLTDGQDVVTFELDQATTLVANGSLVRDGDTISIDGSLFEFNTGVRVEIDEAAPAGLLTENSTLALEGSFDQSLTFEFVRLSQPATGNIGINMVDALGQPRPATAIAADLANAINTNVFGTTAVAVGTEVIFTQFEPTLTASGSGVNVLGDSILNNASAFEVIVEETVSPTSLVAALSDAVRFAGLAVSSEGVQMALPGAGLVTIVSGTAFNAPIGGTGVLPDNISILLLPTDDAGTLASRIATAIQDASDANDLNGVVAVPQGRSLSIQGGDIVGGSTTGGFTAGGVQNPGRFQVDSLVMGVEIFNGGLLALTDTGSLFNVTAGELGNIINTNRTVGSYVPRATDLLRLGQEGVVFTGLRAGPNSVQDGDLADILFATTLQGDIFAFNSFGELQPVFAGGRTSISTGIGGLQGLDFSTLDYSLWHETGTRGGDAGHGINEIDGRRGAVGGGTSLAFNYEGGAHNQNYSSGVETPGATIQGTYNFPGGARGTINSNEFSLEGFAAEDQPTLYFNYFLENDGGADRLRVYIVTGDGVEHVVASNTLARGAGLADDEFDDPLPLGIYDDDIDADVQQLFDNTGSWRQARVPLNEFAGQSNLSLRIDYSTGGATSTGSTEFRALPGRELLEGQVISVEGEVFELDFAPTVNLPSGLELAELYQDAAAVATITVDQQEYVLNDGFRTIQVGQQSIDLRALVGDDTPLASMTATEIATAVAEAIRVTPPSNPSVTGFNLSDPLDAADVTAGTNDFIFEATPLPYSGGNLTIEGFGRFGDIASDGSVSRLDDVDLLRVEVAAGTTISVDVDLGFNSAIDAIIRFFDADGNAVPTGAVVVDVINDRVQYTPTVDGVVFIGISGDGNDAYDPRIIGSASNGQVDTYTATISIDLPASILTDDNVVEFGGFTSVSASPSNLFNVYGNEAVSGVPVAISRSMTAEQVAIQLQRAIANRLRLTSLDYLPVSGATLRLPGYTLNDAGPFIESTERYGDSFGGPVGLANNDFEGAYLDDFIVGFAERGEVATDAAPVGAFFQDQTPNFPVPADPVSDLVTGSYQVEIRDASEYVASDLATTFRTFDTNTRLGTSRTIVAKGAADLQDGLTFSITDGRSTVEFEFDQIESDSGVTPGRVRIPYTLEAIEGGTQLLDPVTGLAIPGTGIIRPMTASEVARAIADAINRPDVLSVLDVRALANSGVDAISDPTVNLFGDVVVLDENDSLEAVNFIQLRGDENRDRDSQGVIIVENSRFLYNEQFGVDISHDLNVNVNGNDEPSAVRYPRNLVELNTESLKPGVIVQSNVFAFNNVGGLQVSGIDPAATESGSDPVPFERIVNNTIIGGRIAPGSEAPAAIFNGVLFPSGSISFADSVVDYSPDAGGGPPTTIHQVPASALGAPDAGGRGPEPIDGTTSVSLGQGGSITLSFDDNLLTGSGDAQPDLIVFETGEIESVRVEISRDGVSFFDVGAVGGLTNRIDIDAAGFGPEDRFAFVRLTDLRQGGSGGTSLGADIDAVGAISSTPVETFTPGGIGINIVGNAAPTLLNNVLANSDQAIQVDDTNTGVVLGANTFYRNVANVPANVDLGEFPQVLSDSEVIFVGPAELIFAPAAGASIIDSSIDSLEDRASLTTVRNPLGIPPSPILAPRLDVNGQLRVDDPNVETPSGLGERVFKDRGASDRGDLDGPRVVLLSPLAPGIGNNAGVATVFGDAPSFFDIQLIDGLPPADFVPGTGIDDRTVNNGSILVLKDNLPLVEGIDYRIGYNASTNIIRITPIAGVFEQDSVYVIRMIDSSDAIVAASNGSTYVDGDRLTLVSLDGTNTTFEYEVGISVTISASVTADLADGITFELFDGSNLLTFEFDNNGLFDAANAPIQIPAAGTTDVLAQALADAINSTPALGFTANVAGNVVQLLGGNPLASVTSNSNFVTSTGQIGTDIGFGIQVPNNGAIPADTIGDGQTFIVRRGSVNEVTYELDQDGIIDTAGATAVSIPLNPTLDDVADAIVRAVGGSGLGLNPTNAGFGRVFLGGDANYSIDLSLSGLLPLGLPGEGPTTPIVIPIDRTDLEISPIIKDAIDGAGLPGVVTSIVDRRVFVEGTAGVSGTGAADTVTITDEVGNELQSNRADGRTELTIFVGGGFDYGDAPAPYLSLDVDGGPRHGIDPLFSLGDTVDADANAKLPNADRDDGVSFETIIQAGFDTNVQINVNNPDGRTFYVDAWFDWDADGQFEANEGLHFGSAGTGRSVLSDGTNSVSVLVPGSAAVGEIYARFRLSESPSTGPVGDASTGEVEDYRLVIGNNPFQNSDGRFDVNDSGAVTPLDALQIINSLRRADSGSINLSAVPLPTNLPPYPDVDGNGRITSLDALQVINELNRIFNSGATGESLAEGEAVAFVPAANGVLASAATIVGDSLIAEASQTTTTEADAPAVDASESKVSVFDDPAVVELDSFVDLLAEDAAQSKDDSDDASAVDRLFASL